MLIKNLALNWPALGQSLKKVIFFNHIILKDKTLNSVSKWSLRLSIKGRTKVKINEVIVQGCQ